MSNVSTQQGEEESLTCAGATPCAIPGKHTEGVSVENVPEQTRWYVLRVLYGRISKVRELFDSDGIEYYIALQKTYKRINGKNKLVKEPILSNLIFVHVTATRVNEIVTNYVKTYVKDKEKVISNYLSYYYNHFVEDRRGHNPPLTISDGEMESFINGTGSGSEHVMVVNPENCHFKSDELVLVTEGEFKGVIGKVARVAGQQRVIIKLTNLCLIATAYIPSAFLKRLEE